MDFIGFDLGKVSSQVCVINEGGELVERRIRTDREQGSVAKNILATISCVLAYVSASIYWVRRNFLQHYRQAGHDDAAGG